VYNIQKDNTNVEINFYMGINEEKGKGREYYVELRILPVSQPFPELTKHIRLLDRIPEAFPGHVRPPARTCPG
jgi:hypothetical protein